jgi:uncharacterized protein YaaR (DUF327 family)
VSLRIAQAAPVTISSIQTARRNSTESDFSFTLNRLSDEGLAARLDNLISEITQSGTRLAEHMDIKDMRRYRGLVAGFINEVVTHGHQFTRENYLDQRGRHRVYGIIRMVDKNLDDLAAELISSERDQIAILDKVDEIRGLLLDIIA